MLNYIVFDPRDGRAVAATKTQREAEAICNRHPLYDWATWAEQKEWEISFS
jgi:hypothetical protein